MNKETILSYLANARFLMREGKFIQSYDEIGFVIENMKANINKKEAEERIKKAVEIANG